MRGTFLRNCLIGFWMGVLEPSHCGFLILECGVGDFCRLIDDLVNLKSQKLIFHERPLFLQNWSNGVAECWSTVSKGHGAEGVVQSFLLDVRC